MGKQRPRQAKRMSVKLCENFCETFGLFAKLFAKTRNSSAKLLRGVRGVRGFFREKKQAGHTTIKIVCPAFLYRPISVGQHGLSGLAILADRGTVPSSPPQFPFGRHPEIQSEEKRRRRGGLQRGIKVTGQLRRLCRTSSNSTELHKTLQTSLNCAKLCHNPTETDMRLAGRFLFM